MIIIDKVKRILKQIIILIVCLFLLINMKRIMSQAHNTALEAVAVCVVMGTTIDKICDIFGGG